MQFGRQDLTELMGIGSYVGEVRPGPDGQLYEWVEGVDGIGNGIGFWKGLTSLVSKAVHFVTKFIPGIGPVIEQVRGAVKGFCTGLPQLAPVAQQSPNLRPMYQVGSKLCNILHKVGIAGDEGMMGVEDGQVYEVIEGIGETGEVKKFLRPVWISIPVVIRPRHHHGHHHGHRHAHHPHAAPRVMQPAQPMQPMQPGQPGRAIAPAAPARPTAPVRRFR